MSHYNVEKALQEGNLQAHDYRVSPGLAELKSQIETRTSRTNPWTAVADEIVNQITQVIIEIEQNQKNDSGIANLVAERYNELFDLKESLQDQVDADQATIHERDQSIKDLENRLLDYHDVPKPEPEKQSSVYRARHPDVDKFDGKKEQVDKFLIAMRLKLTIDKPLWNSEEERLAYIYSRLDGKAADRFGYLFEDGTPELTVDEFLAQVRETFGNLNRIDDNDRWLMTAKQKNQDWSEFYTEFETKRLRSSYRDTPDACRMILQQALSRELISGLLARPKAETYNDLVQNCNEVAAHYRNIQPLLQFRQANSRPRINESARNNQQAPVPFVPRRTSPPARTETQTVSQGGNRMDVDIHARGADGRLTQEAKDARRRQGLCLRCAQNGHIASNCPVASWNRSISNTNADANRKTETKSKASTAAPSQSAGDSENE